MKWQIRRYLEGDEKLILDLRQVIRGQTHSLSYWNHYYLNNPTGPAIIWLAVTNGVAIGHNAIIPTLLKVNGRTIKAGLIVDVWTHPDFQRQGIFTTLHSQALKDAADQGIELTYGFPNNLSYGGLLNLGYKHIFNISSMRKVINWYQVVQSKTKLPLATIRRALFPTRKIPVSAVTNKSNIIVRRLPAFDSRFDRFWQQASRQSTNMVVRDSTYLNWRYAANPRYNYEVYAVEEKGEIVGYTVTKCVREDMARGGLVDMMVLPDRLDAFQMLVSQCVYDLRLQGADIIQCWTLGNTPYAGVIAQNGFRAWGTDAVRFCVRTLSEAPQELSQRCEDWWLCPGDYRA